MNTTYTSLFRISVAHSYYASTNCECFQYEAQPQTVALLKKYGIVFHSLRNGFEVFAATNQTIETFLTYISQVSDQSSFDFSAITTTQAFYAFTEIPFDELGVLTFTSDNAENVKTDQNIQLKATYHQQSSASKAASISIKFQDIINWYEKGTMLQFDIQLEARKTQWNYYIIQNSDQNYEQLSIESKDEAIQFSASQETTLQNGQEALLFSSETMIPLHETVTNKLDLVNTKKNISGERKNIIINGLPIPNPMNIQVQNDHTIASLIYVYI